MSWNRELTLDDALSDPVIRAVMAADRVDPRRFEVLMRATARRLEPGRRTAAPAPRAVRVRCDLSAGTACAW
jgi:hypothetical protein